jgi:hypothetical protein
MAVSIRLPRCHDGEDAADTSKARLLGVRHSLAEAEHFSICLIGKNNAIRHFSPYTTFDISSLIAPHVVILFRDLARTIRRLAASHYIS